MVNIASNKKSLAEPLGLFEIQIQSWTTTSPRAINMIYGHKAKCPTFFSCPLVCVLRLNWPQLSKVRARFWGLRPLSSHAATAGGLKAWSHDAAGLYVIGWRVSRDCRKARGLVETEQSHWRKAAGKLTTQFYRAIAWPRDRGLRGPSQKPFVNDTIRIRG